MILYRSKNWDAGWRAQANCGNTEHRLYLVGKWIRNQQVVLSEQKSGFLTAFLEGPGIRN